MVEAMGSGAYRDIRMSGNYTPEYNEEACEEKLMEQELYLTLQRFFPSGLNWRELVRLIVGRDAGPLIPQFSE